MKSAVATSIALGTSAALAYVQGFDVSDYQGTVDFTAAYNSGARFVIIKVRASFCLVVVVVIVAAAAAAASSSPWATPSLSLSLSPLPLSVASRLSLDTHTHTHTHASNPPSCVRPTSPGVSMDKLYRANFPLWFCLGSGGVVETRMHVRDKESYALLSFAAPPLLPTIDGA